jgi:arsenite methyltransferase
LTAAPTTDVWGRTADIDDSALAVMAARLENRAKHPFFRGVIADYIGDIEPERVAHALEIGCGTGVVSRRLAATPGFRGTIAATDMSAYLIEAARRLAAAEGVGARIAFEVGSAAELHAGDGAYDLAIAHTLFSHAADPVAILKECARVLRPHGRLLIFDRDFASSALSLDDHVAAEIDIADVARAFAAQPFIMRQLPRLFAETGFAIESHRSYVIADVGRAEFFAENLSTWRRLLPVSGVIGKEAADLLMDGLGAASAAGTLFWANNFYTYIAHKTDRAAAQRSAAASASCS